MWGAGLAIRYNDIYFERELGEGRYAKVYKANVYGTDVAVKVPKEDSARILDLFKTEGQTLSRLQHENVCRWLGYSSTIDEQGKEAVLLVTEYLAGGKLQDAIDAHHNKSQPLSLFTRIRMARDIVRGMIFVHEQSLVHHDLKPENLMLDEHGRVKIVDFGFAQLKPREPQRGAPRGSFLWMAPELMTRQPYNHKSDVYSWAIILWQLLTGAHEPYDTYSDRNAFTVDVGERGVRPAIPPDLPQGLRSLLLEAWAQEPERRPSFLEINDRLNGLLVELACPDEAARLFWRRHFAAQDRVPWREVVPALCATFGVPPPEEPGGRNLSADPLPPNPTPAMLHKARASVLKDFMRLSPECSAIALEEFRRRDNIEKLSSLRTVLVERDPYAAQEVVMLERWGKVSALFGPIVPHEPRLFLDRIRAVLRQRWYHGNLSREAACDALKGQPQGTFLVRMSTNPLHSAVLSLNTGRNINHVQIEYVPGRGFRLLGKEQHFPSVTALIEGYILSRVLIEPCPFASPFRSFQETDETVDDIGYYYQLGDDFLMADDDSDGIRALMAQGAAHIALPVPERRQLGNQPDLISLKDWVTLLTYQGASEADIAAHKTRLATRLSLYNFKERQVPMDFNCQFSAVADQVHRSPAGAPTLRQQVVHWLRQNVVQVLAAGAAMCHTLTTETFDAYVSALAEGAWGDHLTLQVLAELLHSRIWVISSVSAAQFVLCINPISPPAPERHFALCHLYSTFYASLELLPPA